LLLIGVKRAPGAASDAPELHGSGFATMLNQMLRFGLFGGSFDPVHLGHLLVAQAAREELRLDRLFFIPAAQSPFKPGRQPTPGGANSMIRKFAEAAFPTRLKPFATTPSIIPMRSCRTLLGRTTCLNFPSGARPRSWRAWWKWR
jgi:hypothetical protein